MVKTHNLFYDQFLLYENVEDINYEKICHVKDPSYAFKWLNRVITKTFEKSHTHWYRERQALLCFIKASWRETLPSKQM